MKKKNKKGGEEGGDTRKGTLHVMPCTLLSRVKLQAGGMVQVSPLQDYH